MLQCQSRPAWAALLGILGVFSCSPALGQHTGDVWVGRSAGGQLTISPLGYVPENTYHTLNPVSGLLKGWTDDDPGFDRTTTDDPANNVYVLQPGAEIWLEVVTLEPAFRVIDSAFQVLDAPGESTYLGNHTLHVHNTWHIKNPDPGYNPDQCVWHGTFILRDEGSTGYADSAPFTFSFTNVAVRAPSIPANGDFDGDSAVDLADYAAFAECLRGPELRPSPDNPAVTTCEIECLNTFDFDNDRDVDLRDFAEFQSRFGR